MARQISMLQQFKPVELLNPATDAAGRTSRYVSLKNALKVFVVFKVAQGNAATVLVSLLQATNVAGASSKAVASGAIIASNLDTSVNDTLTGRTTAATYTTDAALKNKIVVFEFPCEQIMDVNGGFDCLAISTGASNAANITSADIYILGGVQGNSQPNTYVD